MYNLVRLCVQNAQNVMQSRNENQVAVTSSRKVGNVKARYARTSASIVFIVYLQAHLYCVDGVCEMGNLEKVHSPDLIIAARTPLVLHAIAEIPDLLVNEEICRRKGMSNITTVVVDA